VTTPMGTATVFDPDENGEAIDQRVYRSLIVSLLYIMVTQSDIPFVMCLCAHFEASPHPSHRQAVQQIFKYLKYTLEFGIWFSSSSSLDLVGFFMLILRVMELIKRTLLVHVIFLDVLLSVGLLTNNLLLHNPPQRTSM
jgi:hypothetical protein